MIKGQRKGKGNGRKGSGGRRFFKKRKADLIWPTAAPMPGKQKDNGTMIGKMHPGMIGPGTTPKSPTQPRAKARKERKAKEKASLASMMGKDGKGGSKDGAANLADTAQGSAAIAAAVTFYTNTDFNDLSFMATENHEAFITQPLTPTSMVLDLGCTRAMTSRVAAQDLMKFCDQKQGLWHLVQHRRVPVQVHLCELRIYVVQTEACDLHVRPGVRSPVH